MITLVVIEGVLSNGDDLRSAPPQKGALQLHESLKLHSNCVALTRTSEEVARWWLKREHLSEWSSVVPYPGIRGLDFFEWKLDQLRAYLAEGWEMFAYVDNDPRATDVAAGMGVRSMLITYPNHPVGFREADTPPRSWDSIVSTLDAT